MLNAEQPQIPLPVITPGLLKTSARCTVQTRKAEEALGLPNTKDDKWGPSLSGFIIESPWVCPNHGNQFKQ